MSSGFKERSMGWFRGTVMFTLLMLQTTALAGTVRLATDDGQTISGTSYGSGAKGVLLVHDRTRSGVDWENFAGRLADNGFRVLAIDLRGHGASKAAANPLEAVSWGLMEHDVDAGVAWLKKQGSEVAVVGAALGANLALTAASDNADIAGVVMLSPGLNIEGVKVSGAIGAYGGPLLLVASKGDLVSAKAATLLQAKAQGVGLLVLVDANGSGHRLLNTEASLEAVLVGWLNGARGEGGELARPERELSTGEIEDIETTGVKYEDVH
jgi:pimeloyl-ACP methyl ester carboxylesterase